MLPSLSDMVIQFDNQVVLKEGFKTRPYHHNTTLSNDTTQTIYWELGVDAPDIDDGIFTLEPQRGTLERGQRATVRVSFYPR